MEQGQIAGEYGLKESMTGPDTLIVAWQDESSGKYFPVGRLSRLETQDETVYLFVYIRGIDEASGSGFEPFVAFPDRNEVYESSELFPFFANRLVPPSRQDYREFVESLGLDPSVDCPFEVLARSGGRRATDTVEIFPLPAAGPSEEYVAYFFLSHGLRYMPNFAEDAIKDLTAGDCLWIMHDLQNLEDPKAILLRTDGNCPVGFLPRFLLSDTWALLDAGQEVQVYVERVNPQPAPIQQRILCRMKARRPEDFQPFSDETYDPVPKAALLARGLMLAD